MLPNPLAAQSSSPRIALETFFRGSLHGWGRRELAEWLVCHYGVCVRRIENEPAESSPRVVIALPDSRRWVTEERRRIDDASIEALVGSTRRDVLRLFDDLCDPAVASGVTRLAIARGLVERGGHGWVPLDGRRLKLVDRVVSLLVADYLNAPLDYHEGVVDIRPPRCESGLHEIEPAPPTLRSRSMTG